jgi:hypothetical protein
VSAASANGEPLEITGKSTSGSIYARRNAGVFGGFPHAELPIRIRTSSPLPLAPAALEEQKASFSGA